MENKFRMLYVSHFLVLQQELLTGAIKSVCSANCSEWMDVFQDGTCRMIWAVWWDSHHTVGDCYKSLKFACFPLFIYISNLSPAPTLFHPLFFLDLPFFPPPFCKSPLFCDVTYILFPSSHDSCHICSDWKTAFQTDSRADVRNEEKSASLWQITSQAQSQDSLSWQPQQAHGATHLCLVIKQAHTPGPEPPCCIIATQT